MTEEHKKKIGLANSIALKGKHCSPKTEFKKGRISERKGKPFLQIREEKHYRWKGGIGSYRVMLFRRGFEIKECIKCGRKEGLIIHHVDENRNNNDLKNLEVMCYKCHADLHSLGLKTRFQKGHKVSKGIRDKISRSNKGQIPWNKGGGK